MTLLLFSAWEKWVWCVCVRETINWERGRKYEGTDCYRNEDSLHYLSLFVSYLKIWRRNKSYIICKGSCISCIFLSSILMYFLERDDIIYNCILFCIVCYILNELLHTNYDMRNLFTLLRDDFSLIIYIII